MAFGCTGATIVLGAQVRKAKRWCSPSAGSAFGPRVPVQGRQSPANAIERPVGVLREPGGHCGLAGRVLAECRGGHEAAVCRRHPGAPVGGAHVADVRDRPARDARRAWESPAQHRERPPRRARADHGRHLVREDAGQRREVAGVVRHGPERVADRLLAFGHGIEVAHRWSPGLSRAPTPPPAARSRSRPPRSGPGSPSCGRYRQNTGRRTAPGSASRSRSGGCGPPCPGATPGHG